MEAILVLPCLALLLTSEVVTLLQLFAIFSGLSFAY